MSKPEAHSTEWETPQWLFDELDAEFGFVLDAAANPHNTKCASFFYEGSQSTFEIDWKDHLNRFEEPGSIFLNPPYDCTIGQWVRKALLESLRGATVVCVLPVRTSTAWWNEYVLRANEIRFLRGRVRFEYQGKQLGSPREDTAIVVFRGLQNPFEVNDG